MPGYLGFQETWFPLSRSDFRLGRSSVHDDETEEFLSPDDAVLKVNEPGMIAEACDSAIPTPCAPCAPQGDDMSLTPPRQLGVTVPSFSRSYFHSI